MTQKETQPNDEKRIIAPYKNSTRRQRQTNITAQDVPTDHDVHRTGSTKSRSGNTLSDAERDEILMRRASGQDLNTIASQMGRSYHTVLNCVKKLER